MQGLISRTLKNQRQVFVALNPKNLARILEKQKSKFETAHKEKRQKLADLIPELSAFYQTAGPKPKMTFYEGVEGIKTVFWQSLNTKTKEILYLWSAKDMAEILGREEVEEYIEKRIKLKIQAKVIRIRSKEIVYKKSGAGSQYLRELRFAPHYVDFSLALIIYEDKVGIIFSKQENFALLIESEEFAKLQRQLFSALWNVSRPAEK